MTYTQYYLNINLYTKLKLRSNRNYKCSDSGHNLISATINV